ncbi:RING-H2 finger protein ATL51-like [Alnus glutinosa]|uniref:RING-H2 finger protein ATL51-like n=1 Tax=Alnus glutinosa TaxID=3517 RepID=UPI002D79299B|nr:RING-H2 finger protein ATL51-like [Alnus glutinosa]
MVGEDSLVFMIFRLSLVGLLGVVAGAIVVTICYCIAVGWCNQRRRATSPLNRRRVPQTNQEDRRPCRRSNSMAQSNPNFQNSKDQTSQEDGPSSTSINSMVQSNPSFRYSKECEVETCTVCLCEFKEGEEVRVLPECLHLFHVTCVDTWLISYSTCPICRADTMPPLNAVLSSPIPGGTPRFAAGAPQVAGFP